MSRLEGSPKRKPPFCGGFAGLTHTQMDPGSSCFEGVPPSNWSLTIWPGLKVSDFELLFSESFAATVAQMSSGFPGEKKALEKKGIPFGLVEFKGEPS